MISGNVLFERKLKEQSSLLDLMSHHDSSSLPFAATESANIVPRNCRLFQQNLPRSDIDLLAPVRVFYPGLNAAERRELTVHAAVLRSR